MIRSLFLILGLLLDLNCKSSACEVEFDAESIKSPYLQEAFKLTKHFEDFEIANYNYAIAKNKSSTNSLSVRPEAYLENSEAAHLFQKKIYTCDQGKITAAQLLSLLLNARFSFLDNRRNVIINSRNSIENFKNSENSNGNKGRSYLFFGPTHPKFFDDLPEDAKFLARTSIDRYQFINQLILYVWALVDPRQLPADIKLQIRCSIMLWKNLTGERTDLGHPDEAILDYEDDPHGLIKDWSLYDLHLKKREISINLLNWTQTKTTTFAPPYEIEYGKIPEAPYPEWLKPLPRITQSQSHTFSAANENMTSKEQRSNKKPKKQHKLTRAQKNKPLLKESHSQQNKNLLSLEPFTETAQEIKEEVNNVPMNLNLLTNTDSIENKPSLAEKRPKSIKPQAEILPSSQKAGAYRPPNSLNVNNEALLRPRGMRLFHTEQPKIQQPLQKLSGTHAKTLNEIFDLQQFKKVNYAQIKALWKYINGPESVDEKTGSSHKKFISLNGQVFSGFAHGDNMTYTQSTIKYVRDMFREIGYSDKDI